MTKEELKTATGQELIEARDYCGVDGYYRDYRDNVNEEMLSRFNRLAELEKENAELKELLKRVCDQLTYTHRNLGDQLTKAKKIIQEFLELNYSECIKTNVVFLHADKFLSEVEGEQERS